MHLSQRLLRLLLVARCLQFTHSALPPLPLFSHHSRLSVHVKSPMAFAKLDSRLFCFAVKRTYLSSA